MDHGTPAARPRLAYRLADRVKSGPLPRLAFRGHNAVLRLIRPVTLGVRMMILDGDRVCLVRHGYRPGWFLPGGGVARDETLEQAAVREAWEEAAIEVLGNSRFVGIYANLTREKSDHVALFLAERWRPVAGGVWSAEIAECAFFAIDSLPEDTSAATRRRLAEVIHGHPPIPDW